MIVGILEVEIYIYESSSLKDKRRVVKSLVERLKSRYNLSVAEVDLNDKWNRSIIGLAVVSNSKSVVESSLSKILDFIEADTRLEVIEEKIEIL